MIASLAHQYTLCRGAWGVVIVVAMLTLVGCEKEYNAMDDIRRAEEIAEQNPEEALAIMESIDRSLLKEENELAYYSLIFSEAHYYNRNLINNDSLTKIAASYYKQGNNHDCRARAYFQHGMVMQLSGRMTEAIFAFMESLASLEYYDNPRLEGVVHRTMGDIYRAHYCYTNSYKAYKEAYNCFEQLNLPYHLYYTKYNMGQVTLKMANYDEAEALLIEARDYAIETSDRDFLCAVLHELCELYLKQANYAMCSETLRLFDEYDCVLWFVSRYYAVKAIVATEEGRHDEAMHLVAMAESIDSRDEAIIDEAKYHIYSNTGNDSEAIYWLERINSRLDLSLLAAAEQPVLNYQNARLQHTIEREEREMKIRRQRNIAVYMSIAVMVTLLLGFVRGYASRKNRDIQNYIETIHQLQLTTNSTSRSMADAVDQLYNDRLNDLNRLCETYYDHSDTSRHAAKVFDQVRQTIESIKSDEARLVELENLVNNCRDNLMAKLREQCPRLNSKEIKLVLYSYAGFSTRAICIFMESNPVALSKMKYRIKLKIKECNGPDADLLISHISDH